MPDKKLSPSVELDGLRSSSEILKDYRVCCLSREFSILARREVLTGKAKFATTDDGKELLQVAMAKAFEPGDFRAGYYRGHTLLLALGLTTIEELLAQLYADPELDPFSGGRQMLNHHATPLVDDKGRWFTHTDTYNISSDISTTGGQMARGLGLAFASKKYREAEQLGENGFSRGGREVCFVNIGDGSTSEGAFWETLNAAGVIQAPMAVSVWDDGYAISVPTDQQTSKGSISEAVAGMQQENGSNGIDIYQVKGWDYEALCEVYLRGIHKMRGSHTPALFHIQELTQPQGHSTSGSHERYKSKERLNWERVHDCNLRFRQWILNNGHAEEAELLEIEEIAAREVKAARERAWNAYALPVRADHRLLLQLLRDLLPHTKQSDKVEAALEELRRLRSPVRSDLVRIARRIRRQLRRETHEAKDNLEAWLRGVVRDMEQYYHAGLYSETGKSALSVPVVPPAYDANPPAVNGYELINAFFDRVLEKHPELYAFGEDVGRIGDVNQGFAGLQEKYGAHRVFDTGIREWSIVGQAIGMAMRGLRPIAEIQYLDYLIYALSPLSDDLATLRYRSNGSQIAPVIIRTRGHRLEGIWHSGSPMGLLLNSLRGIYILTPRNFTQAAGLYNTMLQSDDPALLIECLNGYRLKENLPSNLGEYTVPLGAPEVLQRGEDLTLVTYGSCVRIAETAVRELREEGISVELIDVQTLLPFDLEHQILDSVKKTNRLLILDEDVPGGASAYILRHVLEEQNAYRYLDSKPVTLTAKAHRPPYGSDGDYFTKPNVEDVYEAIFEMVHEGEPERFEA